MRIIGNIVMFIIIIWAVMYVGAFVIGMTYRALVMFGIPVLVLYGIYKLFKR